MGEQREGSIMHFSRGFLARSNGGVSSTEGFGDRFDPNVDIMWRFYLGNWKLQAENISEEELWL